MALLLLTRTDHRFRGGATGRRGRRGNCAKYAKAGQESVPYGHTWQGARPVHGMKQECMKSDMTYHCRALNDCYLADGPAG